MGEGSPSAKHRAQRGEQEELDMDQAMKLRKLNPIVFLDIAIDKERVGRLIIDLRADICPKTCDNFRALCTGELGESVHSGKRRHYRGW